MTNQERAWRSVEQRKKDVYRRGVPVTGQLVRTEITEAGKLLVMFVHGGPECSGKDEYRMSPKWNAMRLAYRPEDAGYWVYPHCDRCQVWVPREALEQHVGLWRLNGGHWE